MNKILLSVFALLMFSACNQAEINRLQKENAELRSQVQSLQKENKVIQDDMNTALTAIFRFLHGDPSGGKELGFIIGKYNPELAKRM